MGTPPDPGPGRPADEPPPPDTLVPAEQPTGRRHRPWVWIAVCAVLAFGVVGLAIWALSLRSDLDSQQDQTAAAQQQAAKASSEVDQLTEDVNAAVDQASQADAAASEEAQGALTDLKARLGELEREAKSADEGSASAKATATATATSTPASAAKSATPEVQ
jgi:hypothetical protein